MTSARPWTVATTLLPVLASALVACEREPRQVTSPNGGLPSSAPAAASVAGDAATPSMTPSTPISIASSEPPPAAASASVAGDARPGGDGEYWPHGRPPIPHVSGMATSVSPGLSREAVDHVMRRTLPQFLSCYARGLTFRPDLRGSVALSFVVSPTGGIEGVTYVPQRSSFQDPGVAACVVSRTNGIDFPRPDADGGLVSVDYLVIFSQTAAPHVKD